MPEPMDDARLAELLGGALSEDVERPVDTARLTAGARRGARRIRRRRGAGVAVLAVLALASVPAGQQLLETPPASMDVASTPDPTTEPDAGIMLREAEPDPTDSGPTEPTRPSDPPSSGEPVQLISLAAPQEFPDDAALPADAFDRPLVLLSDLGNYAKVPTVGGQECSDSGPFPSAGRSWMWAEENSNRLDQLQVDVVVTGWAGGGGSTAIQQVASNEGGCRFTDPVSGKSPAAEIGDGRWAGTQTVNGLDKGYAVTQLGDVLIAVSVTSPQGPDAAVAEAERLLPQAAERVVASLD